ncbi:hypothetical protein JCM24511_00127 [Saitozyma sp. JCM 24511]|nr:hypothetical protein JCM24511_00127 [Saitozyma sp. JCM 24511]
MALTQPGMTTIRPTNLHRVYLQSLLSRRAMPEEVALELYKRAIAACRKIDDDFRPTHQPDHNGFVAFTGDLTTILEDVGMDVRRSREETKSGRGWLALVNIDPTEAMVQGSDYTPLEIDYYRQVVSGIIASYPANSIGSNHALRLTSELQGAMTKTVADALLKSFVSRGWLARSRAVMELESWLKQEFDDYVQTCKRCDKIVLAGVVCGNEECDAHLHPYCHATILRAQNPRCPACQTSFTTHPPREVGEKAVSRAEDDYMGVNRKRKRPRGTGESGGGADELESEEGEGEGTDGEEGEGEEETRGESSGSLEQVGNGPATWTVARARSRRPTVVPDSMPAQDEDQDQDEEDDAPRTRRRR